MDTSTVNLSSADVELAPPSSDGSQTPSLSSSDVEIEGAPQQQGPVNPYANDMSNVPGAVPGMQTPEQAAGQKPWQQPVEKASTMDVLMGASAPPATAETERIRRAVDATRQYVHGPETAEQQTAAVQSAIHPSTEQIITSMDPQFSTIPYGISHVVKGVGTAASGARAGDWSKAARGGTEAIGGAAQAGSLPMGVAIANAPIRMAIGYAEGLATGAGAKAIAQKLNLTPDEVEFANTAGFFAPMAYHTAIGLELSQEQQGTVNRVRASAFGGRVQAVAATSPDAVGVAGQVGSFKFGWAKPRSNPNVDFSDKGPTTGIGEGPEPPEAAGPVQSAPRPPVPGSGGAPKFFLQTADPAGVVTPRLISQIAGLVQGAPQEMRADLATQAHEQTAQQALAKGSILAANGKTIPITSPDQARQVVGNMFASVGLPRPAPPAPPDAVTVQQQAQSQTITEVASSAASINKQAAQIAGLAPPPPPPPKPGDPGSKEMPMPTGMNDGMLTQDTVNKAGAAIQALPPAIRPHAILEATGNLAKWLFGQKTAIGPDGKVVNVDSQKAAQTVAVKIINDEVDRQTEQAKATQETQQKAIQERQESAKQAQEERDQAISPETKKPAEKSTGLEQPVEIPDTPATQKAIAVLGAAPMDATAEQLDALIRRTATVTAGVRKRLVEQEIQKRANRQEDHAQAGMMGEPIAPGQSREELQRRADAVGRGEHPYVHVPANVAWKPAGVENLARTQVKGAGPFSGTYYHAKEISPAEIRKAARDKTDAQGALDALTAKWKGEAPEQKPIELKAEDVETEAGTAGGKEPQEGEGITSAPGAQPVSSPHSEGATNQVEKREVPRESKEVKSGEVGMMLSAGEVVLTATGRKTTPFPKIDTDSNRKAGNTLKRVDQWLMDNAIAEARARGDEFNLRQFEANRDKPSPADKDSAEMYLFDKESVQSIPKPILKPIGEPKAPESETKTSQPNENTVKMLMSAKTNGYRLDHWLENQPGVKVLSVENESLDPSKLMRLQGWTREEKLEDWKNSNVSVKDLPPVEVVRTPSGDYLYDGTHRTEFATRQGEQVPATVYTISTRGETTAVQQIALSPEAATGLTVLVDDHASTDPTATLDDVLRHKDTGNFIAQALVNDGIITNSADNVNPKTGLLTTSAKAKVGDALLGELLPPAVIEQTPEFLKQKLLGTMGAIKGIQSAGEGWNLQDQIVAATERYGQIFRGLDTHDQGPVVEAILKKLDEPIDKVRSAFSSFAVAATNHDPSDKPFFDFNLAFGTELTEEQFKAGLKPVTRSEGAKARLDAIHDSGMKPGNILSESFLPVDISSGASALGAAFSDQASRDKALATARVEEVPVSKIVTPQNVVSRKTIEGYLSGRPITDDSVVLVKRGGNYYIDDGNHATVAQILQGAKTIRARVIDTEPEVKDFGEFLAEQEAERKALKKGDKVTYRTNKGKERSGEVAWTDGKKVRITDNGSTVNKSIEDVKPVSSPAKESEQTQPEPAADATLVDALQLKFEHGAGPKNYNDLKKIVTEFDGEEPSQLRMKEAQEAYEAAQNRVGRNIVFNLKGDGRRIFDELVQNYEAQPNLSIRTSTSIANQAYSTPLPLAFIADKFAGIDKQTTIYEPTAGNGALLIAANPKLVTANELNPARAQTLKDEGFPITQQDATVWGPPYRVDAVVANPPFGPLAGPVKVDGYNVVKLDHLIVAKALGAMKDAGKAAIIIAAGDRENPGEITNQVRPFFNWLYAHYNVVSDFELEGDLYSRQGASFPVRMIAIDGRVRSAKVSPDAAAIQRLKTWGEVYDKAAEHLGTNLAGQRPADNVAGGPVRDESADTGAVSRTVAGRNRPTDSGEPETSEAGTGSSGNLVRGGVGPISHSGRVPTIAVGSADSTTRPDGDIAFSDRLAEGQPAPRTVRREPAKPDGHSANALADESNQFQATFKPMSEKKDVGIMAPKALVDPMLRAMEVVHEEVGDLDQFVTDQLGYSSVEEMHEAFMGIQTDAIAAAIYQMQRSKALIVADQTGVGKGRVAAAMIRWADLHGHLPIFVTEKANLFSDMYRDLKNIGSGQTITPLLFNAEASITDSATGTKIFRNSGAMRPVLDRIRETGELPKGSNAVFLTYSQINKEDNRQQLTLQRIASNAIFILDESHNAGGDSNTGDFLTELTTASKGVVFLSATWAKRPDNLPLYAGMTDISIAIPDRAKVADAITAGGAPLQAVLTSLLAETGQFVRRERSFDGIEFKNQTDEAGKAKATRISDQVTEILRAIMKADKMFHNFDFARIVAEAKAAGKSAGSKGLTVSHMEFSSTVHNLVRQLLLALKCDDSIVQIVAAIERGERPIYALENTAGSFLEEYIDGNNLAEGDLLPGLDYSRVTDRTLMRTRYYNETGLEGDKRRVTVPLSDLSPAVREAYDEAQDLIDALKVDLPVSPIDYIRNGVTKAGYKIAEITGREWAIDYSGEIPKLTKVPGIERKDRVNTQMQFNNGGLDALLINRAAAAGISLHASHDFRDVRPRHMIVGQPAADVNVVVQMLGRINRTGQVALPLYTMLASALPAEQRPQMNLAKKMKSLNANVSSNTRAATSVQAVDLMNKYGDKIVAQYLSDNPEMARLLGLKADTNEKGEPTGNEGLAMKATGHSALLPVAQQQEFMDSISEAYTNYIDFLDETGQNDLEPRTYDFAARETHIEQMYQGVDPTSPFGQDAHYGEYSIKRQGKPFTPEEVMEKIADTFGPAAMQLPPRERDTLAARDLAAHFEELYKPYLAGLTTEGAVERAQQMRTRGRQLLNDYRVSTGVRIELNGEQYNGVITNIESAKKPSGNPYAPSALQFTIAVNSGLRQTKVPGSQMDALVTSNLGRNADVRQLFKDYGSDRQKAKIITGNLLGAYGELKTGAKGRIISFTMDDGTTKLGILMPSKFDIKSDVNGTYAMRTPEGALSFLETGDAYLQSSGQEIGVVGPSNRREGYEIRTKTSKSAAGKFFLDPKLLDTVQGGEFASSNGLMKATIKEGRELDALKSIMGKISLYANPEHIDKAREHDEKAKAELDKPKVPKAFTSTAAPQVQLDDKEREILGKIPAKWKNSENLLYDMGENETEFRQYSDAIARLTAKGLIERKENVEWGTDFRRTPEGTQALKIKPHGSGSVTMSFLGMGALDPLATKLLQPVVDYAKKAAVATWKEATSAVKKSGTSAKAMGHEVAAAFAPGLVADTDALDIMGKALGEPALRLFEAGQFLHSINQMLNNLSPEERIEFVDRWQTGKEQPTQDLQHAQEFMQEVLSQQRLREQAAVNLGKRKSQEVELSDKANYFPNRYKVAPGGEKALTEDQQIARLGQVSRRPFEGSKAFMKQQRYTLKEAVADGAVPLGNPVEMLLRRLQEGAKFVAARYAWYNFKDQGLAMFLKGSKKLPKDYAYVDDKSGNVWRMVQSVDGDTFPVQTGRWVIQKDAARLLNNYLSVDHIKGSEVLGAFVKLKNFSTEMKLAISAFHWAYITVENMASVLNTGMDKVVNQGIRGLDPTKVSAGLADIGKAMVAPYTAIKRGGQIIQYARNPDEFLESPEGKKFAERYPDFPHLMELLFTGGLRWNIAQQFQGSFGDHCLDAWKDGEIGKGLLKFLPWLSHGLMTPLFNHYIPRSKWAFAVELLSTKLAQYSYAIASGQKTEEEIAREVAQTTDNRFGELNWDSLYLNNDLKGAMQFFFRSATWKIGSWRGLYQAVKEQTTSKMFDDKMFEKMDAQAKKGDWISQARRATSRLPQLGVNAGWILSMALLTTTLGSVTEKLATDKFPWEWAQQDAEVNGHSVALNTFEEAMHPRLGPMDEHGEPIRMSWPTGLKDYEHGFESPGKYVKGGVSDIAVNAWNSMVQNRNFQQDYVYDPNAPLYKEMWQGVKYNAVGDLTPMSVDNWNRSYGPQDWPSKIERATGLVGGAPKWLDRSHALTQALELNAIRHPHTPLTPDQQAERAYSQENPTRHSIRAAARARNLDYLERIFKYELSYTDAKAVYDDPKTTAAERQELKPFLDKKRINAIKSARRK